MVTKIFEEALGKKYNQFSKIEYFQFMKVLRKELLAMILEYEDLFADQIIRNFKIMSWTLKEMDKGFKKTNPKINIKIIEQEIRKNGFQKIVELFNKKNRKIQNFKLEILFDDLSIGDKIHFIKNLDKKKLLETLQLFVLKKDSYLTHLKTIDAIDNFLIPFLEYLRDIRNILSHQMIAPNQDYLFSNAYRRNNRKYHHEFFINVLKDQFILICNSSFYQHLKNAIIPLPNFFKDIFQEVMSQSIYKKI